MKNIKNIIFDLGGVILNIDMKLTERALRNLGVVEPDQPSKQPVIPSFFKEYEAGKIDDASFISSIQSLSEKAIAEEAIIAAWNALLLDFPPERIELIRKLKDKYRLFLLSNTNAIHHKQFQQQFYRQTGYYMDELFEKAYYSHTIGLCKPDVDAFRFVIKENKLDPAETLFIDDTAINLTGAEQAGLQTYHVSTGKTILDIEW